MIDKTKHAAIFLAIFLLWLKTYIVYKVSFTLPIDNFLQEFLLFFNPLSFLVFYFSMVYYFSPSKRRRVILWLSFIYSFILYANIVYYRFFSDFITVPVLFQTKNAGDIGNSIYELVYLTDIFYFLDVMILSFLLKKPNWTPNVAILRKDRRKLILAGLAILAVHISLAEVNRPQLLTRTFDREILVKSLGTFNYHLYDIMLQSKSSMQKALASNIDAEEVLQKLKKDTKNNSELFGVAKGKNVIIVSLESTQNFVLNYKINGKEVTPFLNELARSSYYFNHFYHQTGQGKTSDSEFLVENSLYPLPRGAVFQTNPLNEYNAMPEILKTNGYYSAVFHGNNKSFWNRDVMYKTMGYDKFFSEEYYDITDENSINYGLKDIPFFEQSMPYLEDLPKPFYAKFITLTNHHPFLLDEEDQWIDPYPVDDGTVSRYFTTVRYEDEALKLFFEDLKKSGLYDNSVVVVYGDHYGISERHEEAMAEVLGKENLTPYDHIQLQQVPLFIHIPGKKGENVESVGGQVDLKPTLLHLLGIETKDDVHFGTDLFSEDHNDLTVLRNGAFINKNFVYTNETCYSNKLGTPVDIKNCEPYIEESKDELDESDRIVYGDLLRFLK
ncbi:LTA synthase family protein [Bacillus sp. NEB1478]|uniref:LTA synthase family protein n=1 Tax=Bacillus sp. NEB1478 TaxID=3073816 RepID=UPI002872F286|nr:LTA synthase family protein [Bacillus sp. NEB1478]WNB91897.1 LTA synthase family protein [Bacillus sp. NEB1478]